MKPDLNLLLVFDAVSRFGSVTAAADHLALSQPAVSHALNRLRLVLEDPLFTRSGRGMVPTPRALAMQGPVRDLLEQAAALLSRPEFAPQTARRTFSIGASDYSALTLLPDVIAAVQREAPQVTIQVQTAGADTLAMLPSGALDLSYWGTQAPGPPYHQHKLFEEHFVGVARADHPIFDRDVTLARYLETPHAMVSLRDPGANVIETALKELGMVRRVGLVTGSFAACMAALRRSDMIANLPSRLCVGGLAEGLRRFALPLDIPGYGYSLIWHSRTGADPGLVWLRGILLRAAGAG